MNIFDVVVDTDDLVVLGSPSVMDVTFDIGNTGQRGSKIFVGSGDPNSYNFGTQTVYENDMYINTALSNLGWLYTYVSGPTGNSWIETLKMQPPMYANYHSITFTDGVGTVPISLINICGTESITDVSKYVVTITPMSANPAATTVTSKTISGTAGSKVLNVNISMLTGTVVATPVWSRASGAIDVAISIQVIS